MAATGAIAPKSKKSGLPRKSRRARLGSAMGMSYLTFEPTDADWHRIACAYGVTLSPDHRSRIAKIVKGYLEFEHAERDAPFLDDALAYLDESEKLTEAFW